MSIKIVRNDITKMQVDAIVNTANNKPTFGTGCDYAVYHAAGKEELLAIRQQIGAVPEGEAFITPGLKLPAKYIIHAVSPLYIDGQSGEEEKLRSCYQMSLALAEENGIQSIAFPLISTGGFGYPKEEGMRIALDEINAFLLNHEMLVYLVMFGSKDVRLGKSIYPDLESYIDQHYVEELHKKEYGKRYYEFGRFACAAPCISMEEEASVDDMDALQERISHRQDTFSEYLLYLIESKGMSNAEVYKNAVVDKKVFSKIKNNPDYQPKKITAMCLCVGAKLNLDETKDLLARAGYALSPCDKRDIIFSFFIEKEHYDIIDLDIMLEEYGLPCLIE